MPLIKNIGESPPSTFPQRTTLRIGGVDIDNEKFQSKRAGWKEEASSRLNDLEEQLPINQFPSFYRNTLEAFGLIDQKGVPPNLAKRGIKIKGAVGYRKPATTHGLIAAWGLEILKNLPKADSLEDGIAQLFESFIAVNDRSKEKGDKLKPTLSSDYRVTEGIKVTGPAINKYENQAYSAIQTEHIVFVDQNGAIQILKVPTPKELSLMFKDDEVAWQDFLGNQPLKRDQRETKITPKTFLDLEKLIHFLEMLEKGKYKTRANQLGATDVHYILEKVDFDFVDCLERGFLKILFDKLGEDGNGVEHTLELTTKEVQRGTKPITPERYIGWISAYDPQDANGFFAAPPRVDIVQRGFRRLSPAPTKDELILLQDIADRIQAASKAQERSFPEDIHDAERIYDLFRSAAA